MDGMAQFRPQASTKGTAAVSSSSSDKQKLQPPTNERAQSSTRHLVPPAATAAEVKHKFRRFNHTGPRSSEVRKLHAIIHQRWPRFKQQFPSVSLRRIPYSERYVRISSANEKKPVVAPTPPATVVQSSQQANNNVLINTNNPIPNGNVAKAVTNDNVDKSNTCNNDAKAQNVVKLESKFATHHIASECVQDGKRKNENGVFTEMILDLSPPDTCLSPVSGNELNGFNNLPNSAHGPDHSFAAPNRNFLSVPGASNASALNNKQHHMNSNQLNNRSFDNNNSNNVLQNSTPSFTPSETIFSTMAVAAKDLERIDSLDSFDDKNENVWHVDDSDGGDTKEEKSLHDDAAGGGPPNIGIAESKVEEAFVDENVNENEKKCDMLLKGDKSPVSNAVGNGLIKSENEGEEYEWCLHRLRRNFNKTGGSAEDGDDDASANSKIVPRKPLEMKSGKALNDGSVGYFSQLENESKKPVASPPQLDMSPILPIQTTRTRQQPNRYAATAGTTQSSSAQDKNSKKSTASNSSTSAASNVQKELKREKSSSSIPSVVNKAKTCTNASNSTNTPNNATSFIRPDDDELPSGPAPFRVASSHVHKNSRHLGICRQAERERRAFSREQQQVLASLNSDKSEQLNLNAMYASQAAMTLDGMWQGSLLHEFGDHALLDFAVPTLEESNLSKEKRTMSKKKKTGSSEEKAAAAADQQPPDRSINSPGENSQLVPTEEHGKRSSRRKRECSESSVNGGKRKKSSSSKSKPELSNVGDSCEDYISNVISDKDAESPIALSPFIEKSVSHEQQQQQQQPIKIKVKLKSVKSASDLPQSNNSVIKAHDDATIKSEAVLCSDVVQDAVEAVLDEKVLSKSEGKKKKKDRDKKAEKREKKKLKSKNKKKQRKALETPVDAESELSANDSDKRPSSGESKSSKASSRSKSRSSKERKDSERDRKHKKEKRKRSKEKLESSHERKSKNESICNSSGILPSTAVRSRSRTKNREKKRTLFARDSDIPTPTNDEPETKIRKHTVLPPKVNSVVPGTAVNKNTIDTLTKEDKASAINILPTPPSSAPLKSSQASDTKTGALPPCHPPPSKPNPPSAPPSDSGLRVGERKLKARTLEMIKLWNHAARSVQNPLSPRTENINALRDSGKKYKSSGDKDNSSGDLLSSFLNYQKVLVCMLLVVRCNQFELQVKNFQRRTSIILSGMKELMQFINFATRNIVSKLRNDHWMPIVARLLHMQVEAYLHTKYWNVGRVLAAQHSMLSLQSLSSNAPSSNEKRKPSSAQHLPDNEEEKNVGLSNGKNSSSSSSASNPISPSNITLSSLSGISALSPASPREPLSVGSSRTEATSNLGESPSDPAVMNLSNSNNNNKSSSRINGVASNGVSNSSSDTTTSELNTYTWMLNTQHRAIETYRPQEINPLFKESMTMSFHKNLHADMLIKGHDLLLQYRQSLLSSSETVQVFFEWLDERYALHEESSLEQMAIRLNYAVGVLQKGYKNVAKEKEAIVGSK